MLDLVVSTVRGVLNTIQSVVAPSNIDNSPAEESPDPVSTIIKIALLLRTRLPADIVPMILDYAELWIPVASAHSLKSDIDKIGQAQSPKLQVALTIPDNIANNSIRRVRFTIVSRDQGWSSYPQDHGTYHGSWTWFEAGVRGLLRNKEVPGESELETNDQAELSMLGDVHCTHRNALDEEHRLQCQPQMQFYKYGSREVIRNIHAGRDFKTHTVEWALNDPDMQVVRTVRELRKGCRIEVAAFAMYPGWINYVKSVQIEIEGMVIRKL